MGVFYRKLWQEKLPPLEALRQAQFYLYRNPSAIPELAKRRGDLFAEVDVPKETVKPGEKAKRADESVGRLRPLRQRPLKGKGGGHVRREVEERQREEA